MPATNELLQEGRYRIDQTVTGSDNVFEAYDTVRNTPVVVREIPVKLNKVMTASQQESLKIAFTNQATALKDIRHESLLPVHDFFSEIDRQYLVMEAVEGKDLASVLTANKRPFSVAEITRWADELLDALNYLHSQRPSIMHRNVRPQNLKLNNGKVKLFGVGLDSDIDSGDS
ncbi:MAG TPA: protein kinase, partial [Pyrinomonadaceae bacterium]|nr:protein kinase [Pyrinomonadaceae bacterium]